ncbi:TetR/AcrR family transcriptional regulator [Corynebacterium sp. 335C]
MAINDPDPRAETPSCGLRERRRRVTRRLVEDAATTLVLERGYDSVTVEDVCAAAEISRRTFFNYFTSKDAAIFGGGGTSLSADQIAGVRDGRGTDPLADLLSMLEDNLLEPPEGDGDLDDPRARHRRMRERRRAIVAADPRLAKAWLAVFEDGVAAVGHAVADRLAADPAARRLRDIPAAEEAVIVVSLLRAALNDAMFRDTVVDGSPLHDAVSRITRFLAAAPEGGRKEEDR